MKRNCGSSSIAQSIGNSATACNAMRPFHCSRISANTPHEISVCLPIASRYACAARRCRARRRSAARSPCAFATSSRDQLASRSAITALRAPRCVPSGFCARVPDVALVDMGVHVDEARQHDAVVEIDARQPVLALPGRSSAMRALSITMLARREAVGVGRELRRVGDETDRHARVGEAIARDVRNGDRSRASVLPVTSSC